ncbi:MAG TPA: hypothetical protein VJH55_03100 [Candidatus Paceibacterota bacterium]
MRRKLIVPLTKSSFAKRLGPEKFYDWVRGLKKAHKLCDRDDTVLVVSAVHIEGFKSEAVIYKEVLLEWGITEQEIEEVSVGQRLMLGDKNFVILEEAQETIGQLEIAYDIAEQNRMKLVVVSTWTHYLRVAWLLWRGPNRNYRHYIAWGVPYLREAITDAILTLLFPLIDLAGRRSWFLDKVTRRRKSGKF